MKWGAWIPPWVPLVNYYCARFDCEEVREECRRYCSTHCEEYEREASEIPEDKKLLRPGCFGERAGVSGNPQDRGRASSVMQDDAGGNGLRQPGRGSAKD